MRNDQPKSSVAVALFAMGMALGQAFAPTGSSTFEVASFKPSKPGSPEGGVHPAPGGRRYVGSNWALRNYLAVAYQVKVEQITGGPGWMDTDFYDLNAEAAKPSSIEELHIMLQNLLTERVKLQVHREKKEMQAYTLTVDRSGTRNLKPHPNPGGGDLNFQKDQEQFLHAVWTANCATMDYFAFVLGLSLDRPVLNQTGITGCFDFKFKFTWSLPPGMKEDQTMNGIPIDTSGPTIYQALEGQLGLKLEAKKAFVETMVIDYAERPTED
jgi:uncharacterized protein (TIGR03435 family)